MPNIQFGAPGVYISEQLQGPTPGPLPISPSVAGFIGEHWRGPTTYAIQCNSWSDFVRFYGGFNPNPTPVLANPYLAYSVYEFFSNGGQSCWVLRVGASATPGATATTTLIDRAATPQNTLSLTAGIHGTVGNVGTWGNNLYVDVVSNASGPGRFNLNIYYGGSTPQFIVEQWTDLSMNKQDARYVPSILNSSIQGSNWVVAQDLNDVTAAPNNAPAVVTGRQFTGGIDTADPSSADLIATLQFGQAPPVPFDLVVGPLNINIPGNSTAAVIDAAITYAGTRPYTFLVIDTPSGQTPAGALSYFGTLAPISSFAAVYYPWVQATNPASSNLQSVILLPPGGFVLGEMTEIDNTAGVWVAPAGLNTTLVNVVQAERPLAPSDLSSLNLGNVNALRQRANGQVVIWGTRTMQSGYATLYVPIRRTLNYIEASLTGLLEFAVFQPNDQLLWTQISSICNNFLAGLFSLNAFPGQSAATSYYVICNASNNTPQTIAQGVVNTTVGIALLYPAEFISLTIAQFQSTGQTTVTASTV